MEKAGSTFKAQLNKILNHSPAKDLENNFKALLSQGFNKLDLVTKEEFDHQVQVLARTRALIESLEKRVTELEKNRSTAS